MHHPLSTGLHVSGLVVPGWQVHTNTELLLTLFIVLVVVLVQSAVKAAEHAVRTTFSLKKRSQRLLLHSAGTVLLAIDVLLGYVLMLAVMSGSVWILLTVIGSSSLGYVLFWWLIVPLGRRRRRAAAADGGGGGGGGGEQADGGAQQRTDEPALPESRPLVEAHTPLQVMRNGVSDRGSQQQQQPQLTTFASSTPAHEMVTLHNGGHVIGKALANGEWQRSSADAQSFVEQTGLAHSPANHWAVGVEPSNEEPADNRDWQGSGRDLFNKYPMLTKYRKLDFEENTSKEIVELDELDSALQELSSFQHLQI